MLFQILTTCLCAGKVDIPGKFVGPTLLANVKPDSKVVSHGSSALVMLFVLNLPLSSFPDGDLIWDRIWDRNQ
jgi:hypothetical protein